MYDQLHKTFLRRGLNYYFILIHHPVPLIETMLLLESMAEKFFEEFLFYILLNLIFSPYLRSKLRGSPFNPSDPISLRLFPALFYFSFAIAGLTGGLVHQFFPPTNAFSDTPLGWELLWRITVIMTGFAGSALILTVRAFS